MRLSIFFCFLFASTSILGQDELAKTGRKILEDPEYAERKSANAEFLETLEEYISTEEGFNDPLKSVTNMMRLADEGVRVYTWQMPDSLYRYVKYGLVAVQTKKGIEVTRLQDQSEKMSQAQFKILKAENWYGAIYYKIIPVKKGRQTIYTLLGFAPGKELNKKIVEVMEIDQRGRPRFGAKVFAIDQFMDQTLRRPPMRLILSYSGKYSASVRWNEKKEMIVMDHLAPPEEKLKGVYQMYGPDMSYDGLTWDGDWWNLEQEVEFDSGQNVPIVPPDKPADLPGKRQGAPPADSEGGER